MGGGAGGAGEQVQGGGRGGRLGEGGEGVRPCYRGDLATHAGLGSRRRDGEESVVLRGAGHPPGHGGTCPPGRQLGPEARQVRA